MLLKLVKIIVLAASLSGCLAVLLSPAFASENAFVTIVNPVRGKEFWGLEEQDPLDAIAAQYEIIKNENSVATWLLRYDAINDPEIASFFKDIDKNHELGIFLEIIPSLTEKAEVNYSKEGVFWHDAHRVFLSGYKPEERKRLIDAVFGEFLTLFGYYPKSVGAWHVDAFSASYMREKYGITGILVCADQFSTDNYQIWGQPWGVPYYPSRFNIQMPGQTVNNKLDLVVFQWAVRDPEKAYGGSVKESIYSVQANDYTKHGLETDYFLQLVETYTNTSQNPFGQITVGLENDQDWRRYGGEYRKQIKVVSEMKEAGKIEAVTMANFAFWYKNYFPMVSPRMEIKYKKAKWISDPQFRVGIITKNGQDYIRDLRIYNERWPEPYWLTPNPWPDLSLSIPAEIDTVRFPEGLVKYTQGFISDKLVLPYSLSKVVLSRGAGSRFAGLSCCLAVLLFLSLLFLKNKWLGLLVALGTLGQSLTMVKSGLLYPFGMGFWGPNGHDGVWHVALINQIAQGKLSHPTFAHFNLANYHIGFDFLVALIHKTTGISVVNLYFQILPVIFSILLGALTYFLVKKWIKSESAALLSTFFVYFAGSWGWVVSWFRDKTLGGESLFWAHQSVSFLINPPYALSVIVFFLGLYMFLDYLQKSSRKFLIVSGLVFGILIQIKVYAGVIVLISLFLTLFFTILLNRNVVTRTRKSLLALCSLSLIVALLVFLPSNRRAGSLLVFSPLWFPRTMLAFQDRLGWIRLENARQAYLATHQWFRWILAEGLALGIFIVGNLGTRVLGFGMSVGWIRKCLRRKTRGRRGKEDLFPVFLFFCLLVSLTLTLTLTQEGNPWNTIQFFYYFQSIIALLAGVYLARILSLFKGKLGKLVLFVILVLLTIPTTVGTLFYNYLPFRPPARVSFGELEALEFLRNQPEGVVLTYSYNPEWREKFTEPKPLYAYETTAYVSAFSGKQTFLEDEMNLEISGYNWRPRREESLQFFATDNQKWADKFLQENQIRYIYLVKGQKMNLGEDDIRAKKIFENGEVRIYNRDTYD